MPLLLRKVRKERWQKAVELPWLAPDDLPADPLADLTTTDNQLSVWHVATDRSNLEEVLLALASNCEKISKIDYLVFDSEVLAGLGVAASQSLGATRYEPARKWHYDLTELSALRLVHLARELLHTCEVMRKPEKEVLYLLVNAVQSGELEPEGLAPKLGQAVAAELGKRHR